MLAGRARLRGRGRGRGYVGDSARPVFLTSWEMLSRSSAVLVRRLKVVRGTTEAFAARAGAGVANRVLQEAADGAVTVPRALLPAIVRRRRRRRRARRGLARRGRHVVRIGMGLALMVQIDAINDRVVLVAVRGISAAIRITRAVFVDVVVLVGMALLATPIFLVLVTLV